MKKLICLTLIATLVLSGVVYAERKILYDNTSKPAVPIQNLKALAPTKGKSGCVTKTMTKGTFDTYTSVDGYLGYSAEVVTAAGAAEPVKWELDGTQVATGASFEFTNPQGNTFKRAVQRVYSAQTARALTSCTRRQ
jgi:hypothetical protein